MFLPENQFTRPTGASATFVVGCFSQVTFSFPPDKNPCPLRHSGIRICCPVLHGVLTANRHQPCLYRVLFNHCSCRNLHVDCPHRETECPSGSSRSFRFIQVHLGSTGFISIISIMSRGNEMGMDFEYQNRTGPLDAKSPFAQYANQPQRSFATPSKRRTCKSATSRRYNVMACANADVHYCRSR